MQTGLNNNLHAIYGGVQFGRVAWELVSGESSTEKAAAFTPWKINMESKKGGLEDDVLFNWVFF